MSVVGIEPTATKKKVALQKALDKLYKLIIQHRALNNKKYSSSYLKFTFVKAT